MQKSILALLTLSIITAKGIPIFYTFAHLKRRFYTTF